MQIQTGIITISDRASKGLYDDLGGPWDGVWANAVLLYVDRSDFPVVLACFHDATRAGGTFGLMLKEGDGESWSTHGNVFAPRHFTFWCEEPLRVAAEADGAVHHPAAAAWMEEEGDFVQEDWEVGGHGHRVLGFCILTRCVFGLTPADTGSFSFECARLAFGCASPSNCLVIRPHGYTPLSARRVRRSSSGPACSRW